MQFVQAVDALRVWFAEKNISTSELTLIINFQDSHPAVHFDFEIRKELDNLTIGRRSPGPLKEMQLQGLTVKVESPLHPHTIYQENPK